MSVVSEVIPIFGAIFVLVLSLVFTLAVFALSQSVIMARSEVDPHWVQLGFALTLSCITSPDISTAGRNKTKSNSTRYESVDK